MSDEEPARNGPRTQAERQEWIARYVLERGSAQIDELAERLRVSRMTIHRDLDDLERQGVLRKVRNGATAQPSSLFESDVRYRMHQQWAEKEAIARAALAHVEPGQAILMDEATTLLPLVQLLPGVGSLTVITNFLPILNTLSRHSQIHLIALGGEYLPRFDTFTGLLCEQSVNDLRADIFFTSTTAVLDAAAYHPEQQIVGVKRAMMARSAQRYLLVDHSKFGHSALHQVAPLAAFDAVIVDDGIDPAHLRALHEAGVRVEVAPRR